MTDYSVATIARSAKYAARQIAAQSGMMRVAALEMMPETLQAVRRELAEANAADIADARAANMPPHLIKRLEISDRTLAYMTARLKETAALPDPVGKVLEGHTRPDGLKVVKVTVPIGVIAIIYESRPNVTTDAAAVCLKSGNAVILRGGSEALRTNIVLADAMTRATLAAGLPETSLQIIRVPGHEAVGQLLEMDDCIDVIIPRGGKELIRRISQGTRIPVIKHYDGICHLYLAADAPEDMSIALVINSKCERVEVCNALETLLIDSEGAGRLLPAVVTALRERGVECRGCETCRRIMPDLAAATEEDWHTEYLAPILSIRIVNDLNAAVEHINEYGSGHTDGIVTRRMDWADRFVLGVDSGSVMVNASTRLSGGGAYGMGAVVGISTDKLHARGPVGPRELTSSKWIAVGNGHLRE